MRVALEVIKGPQKGLLLETGEPGAVLAGRCGDAQFRFSEDDPYISRRHFLLEIRPPRCVFRELDCTNPTRINRVPAREKVLAQGDIIEAGYTHMRVHLDLSLKTQEVPCGRCGAGIVLVEGEAPPGLCSACRRAEEESSWKSTPAARCEVRCRCGKDLTDRANSDGRAADLGDIVFYSCEDCLPRRDEEGGMRIDGLEVVRKLGEGGMGKVYMVYDRSTARVFALKQVLGLTNEVLVKRFEREVRILRECRHENIIRYVDNGVGSLGPYVVLEYVSAGDLGNMIIKRGGGIPVDEAVGIAANSLDGLEYLHNNGVIHRDIKPQNILLKRGNGSRLVPKITDFGLSKHYNDAGGTTLTQLGEAFGTEVFMPPEQFHDVARVSRQADTYAMGITLYYALTGRFPYEYPSPLDAIRFVQEKLRKRADPVAALRQMLENREIKSPYYILMMESDPVPLRRRNPAIPGDLSDVVDQAIRKEIGGRFQTARELAEAIRACDL